MSFTRALQGVWLSDPSTRLTRQHAIMLTETHQCQESNHFLMLKVTQLKKVFTQKCVCLFPLTTALKLHDAK